MTNLVVIRHLIMELQQLCVIYLLTEPRHVPLCPATGAGKRYQYRVCSFCLCADTCYGEQVYVHRIRKYLGAYMVHLKGRVDAIVMSAGVGENSPPVRKLLLADLEVRCVTPSCLAWKFDEHGSLDEYAIPNSQMSKRSACNAH